MGSLAVTAGAREYLEGKGQKAVTVSVVKGSYC